MGSVAALSNGASTPLAALPISVEHSSIKGLALRDTTGRTQCETLLRVLQYLGDRGINTPEGVGCGFYRIATRVQELEASGWLIASRRESMVGADGLHHIGVARYSLIGERSGPQDPQFSLDLGVA